MNGVFLLLVEYLLVFEDIGEISQQTANIKTVFVSTGVLHSRRNPPTCLRSLDGDDDGDDDDDDDDDDDLHQCLLNSNTKVRSSDVVPWLYLRPSQIV